MTKEEKFNKFWTYYPRKVGKFAAQRSWKRLKVNDINDIFSVYKEHWVPRWTKEVNPDGWDVNNRPMRQQMDEKYVENGAFYITKKENLLQSKLRYSGKIGVVELPLHKSFQIDTEEDLALIGNML